MNIDKNDIPMIVILKKHFDSGGTVNRIDPYMLGRVSGKSNFGLAAIMGMATMKYDLRVFGLRSKYSGISIIDGTYDSKEFINVLYTLIVDQYSSEDIFETLL